MAAYLFPQTVLWGMQECSFQEAQYVLAKVRPSYELKQYRKGLMLLAACNLS